MFNMSSTLYNASQDHGGKDKVSTAVYATQNYAQFKFDPTNRPVVTDKVQRLYDSIQAKNMLADNPILVGMDMTILDGQHRTKAAEALGVPIFYMFASDATMEDVPGLNNRRVPWTSVDYLAHWCAVGKQEYIKLRDFIDKYPFIPPTVAIDLCYYGTNLGLRDRFNRGEYECNDLDFAMKVVAMLQDFRSVGCKHWKQKIFIDAVSNLASNSIYDHKRMMQKLAAKPQLIHTVATTIDDYFAIFNEAYNWKARDVVKVELKRGNSNQRNYRKDKKN